MESETMDFVKDMTINVFKSRYWDNVKFLCNHYTENLKREIKYVDKMCKRAVKGKELGTYSDFAFKDLCITNSLECVRECVKDQTKNVNIRLAGLDVWYNDDKSIIPDSAIDYTMHGVIEASKSIDELDKTRKLLEFKYDLLKVLIKHCLVYPKYNSWKYLRLYPRPKMILKRRKPLCLHTK